MTASDEGFGQRVLASQKALADEVSKRRLCIAVLGPNLDDAENIGARKRRQIADTLTADGHQTFFPEQVMDNPFLLWIEQEQRVLSSDDVDFVIILHTESSAGALGEIFNFVSVPAIRVKTGILFPFRSLHADAESGGKHGASLHYKNAVHRRTLGVLRDSRRVQTVGKHQT